MTTEEWERIIITSHYMAGVKIQNYLKKGDVQEAQKGLELLLRHQKDWQQMELEWKLRDLMFHILMGMLVPQKRTVKWSIQLDNLRTEIENHRYEIPIMDDNYVKSIWQKVFHDAKENAEIMLNKSLKINLLTWHEVFEEEYSYRTKKQRTTAR